MEEIIKDENSSYFQEHPSVKFYQPPYDVSLYYNSEIDGWIWGVPLTIIIQ